MHLLININKDGQKYEREVLKMVIKEKYPKINLDIRAEGLKVILSFSLIKSC
jgi:hypothetical protein